MQESLQTMHTLVPSVKDAQLWDHIHMISSEILNSFMAFPSVYSWRTSLKWYLFYGGSMPRPVIYAREPLQTVHTPLPFVKYAQLCNNLHMLSSAILNCFMAFPGLCVPRTTLKWFLFYCGSMPRPVLYVREPANRAYSTTLCETRTALGPVSYAF